MSDLIEIGALWRSSGGKALATGKLGKGRLVVLPNDKRGNEKAPDWRLFIAPDNREGEQQQSGGWDDERKGSAGLDEGPPW